MRRSAGGSPTQVDRSGTKWVPFLMSLKELVETERGSPAPHDVRISDWH
ncbi:hypothetical protein ACLQ24_24255 [Micromonospora sp. DT4]